MPRRPQIHRAGLPLGRNKIRLAVVLVEPSEGLLPLPKRDNQTTGYNQSAADQHLKARKGPKGDKGHHLPHAKKGGYV